MRSTSPDVCSVVMGGPALLKDPALLTRLS